MDGQEGEWTDNGTRRGKDGGMDGRTEGQSDRKTNGCRDGQTEGQRDRGVDIWTEGQTDGQTDRGMDSQRKGTDRRTDVDLDNEWICLNLHRYCYAAYCNSPRYRRIVILSCLVTFTDP